MRTYVHVPKKFLMHRNHRYRPKLRNNSIIGCTRLQMLGSNQDFCISEDSGANTPNVLVEAIRSLATGENDIGTRNIVPAPLRYFIIAT